MTVRQVASAALPTRWGPFQALGFERDGANGVESALVLVHGQLGGSPPLVRLQSQCTTGEVFGSLRCDCAQQLSLAMRLISAEYRGLVIYDDCEGRGIGLMAKLRAYELQDAGLDTVSANLALGFMADHRDFSLSAAIVQALGVRRVRLLSNNPRKVRALADAGIEVAARIPCEALPTPESLPYLRAKKEKLGHLLTLRTIETNAERKAHV
jgi:GTP cyclohydrolase II